MSNIVNTPYIVLAALVGKTNGEPQVAVSTSDLADQVGVSGPTVSAAMRVLEDDGFVKNLGSLPREPGSGRGAGPRTYRVNAKGVKLAHAIVSLPGSGLSKFAKAAEKATANAEDTTEKVSA